MTPAEANANIDLLQKGEHPRGLRAHLRKVSSKDH
jgi:hypothetical protein